VRRLCKKRSKLIVQSAAVVWHKNFLAEVGRSQGLKPRIIRSKSGAISRFPQFSRSRFEAPAHYAFLLITEKA